MLSLVKPPKSPDQFDAQNQAFKRRFSEHLTFFRLVNTICATKRTFSDAYGSVEFKLAW